MTDATHTDPETTPHDVSSTVGRQLAEHLDSRRAFLAKTASVGLGTLALTNGASARRLAATTDETEETDGDLGTTARYLKYALTLEQLEATFYRNAVDRFSDRELQHAEILCQRNEELNADVPARIRAISQHEQDHVAALTTVVKALGAKPPQVEFTFPYETPSEFLQIARLLENTGVSAYDGALAFVGNNLPALGSTILQTAGATIATVEARHASYLNTLTGTSPFPTSFDEPQSMDSILAKASPFIKNFKDKRQRFLVQVEDVSTKNTYDVGSKTIPVPLSPGAYAIHRGGNPLYTPGTRADTGLERIAEDGFPFKEAASLAGRKRVIESGTFASFSTFPPAITPTETARFFVTSHPTDHLSFATMFVPSNDLFIGPDESGIALFENGEPISGEVTNQLTLWDAGTEVDQQGVGSFAKPNQALLATDVGQAEDKPIRPAREANPDRTYPDLSEVLTVTVTPM